MLKVVKNLFALLVIVGAAGTAHAGALTLMDSSADRDANDLWTLTATVKEPGNAFVYSGTMQAGGSAWSPALPHDQDAMNLISTYETSGALSMFNDFGSQSSVRTDDFSLRVTQTQTSQQGPDPDPAWTITNVTFSVAGVGTWTPAQFQVVLVNSGLFTPE